MSYEGSTEYLCENGHYMCVDIYQDDIATCPQCKGALKWCHSIDETNGEVEGDPSTYRAPKRVTGTYEITVTRHTYEPEGNDWQPVPSQKS